MVVYTLIPDFEIMPFDGAHIPVKKNEEYNIWKK